MATPAQKDKEEEKCKPDLSVGDLKYLLSLSLVYSGINDDTKLKFDDAKAIIDLITGKCTREDDPPGEEPNEDNEADGPKGVIGDEEYKRLENLGLGRGVDTTKPFPWQSKSSFQVRKVDTDKCKNIIGTEESGKREYYEEEVNSVLTQQFNTNLTIEEPSNSLTIGIGAEHSRSFAETRKAVGHKVMTRSAAFRTNYADECDDFEEKLSEWVLQRIETKRNWALESGEDLTKLPGIPEDNKNKTRLEKYITDIAKKAAERATKAQKSNDRTQEEEAYRETRALLQHCYDYVEHLGITHYVHTIKLGAAEYEVLTQETYDSKFTATPSFGINKVAKAVISAHAGTSTHKMRKSKTVNSIGKIEKDLTVKKEPPYEAVLEIELKPLHSLVRSRALQLALQWALRRYIKRREARKEGPFLIACGPDSHGVTVYWWVEEKRVHGTTDKKKASLFYIIKTESSKHPHEFYIGYVGDDMTALDLPRGPANPMSKSEAKLAPIPQYVTADLKTTGWSNDPLGVIAGVHKSHARFTLHSSAVRKYAFTRRPVDTDQWPEGGGFFINCARRSFKLDGYVAMFRDTSSGTGNETQTKESGEERIELKEIKEGEKESEERKDGDTYRTICMTSVKSHKNDWPWMVFHLLPGEHKDKEGTFQERVIGREELREPLIDRSRYPITYQSDARDFKFLFGDPSSTPDPEKSPTAQSVKEAKPLT